MDKRLGWADIAKGIGIILVVFAHTLVPKMRDASDTVKFIWIFIYNFHMPLFFFISGWLFERNLPRYTGKAKFIGGKARLLMLPYLVFSLLAYAVIFAAMKVPSLAGVLSGGGYGTPSVRDMVLGILFYHNHADQHLWFVYSLFIVFTVNILLPRVMKSKITLLVLVLLYVSKAFVHYPAILDYTASDLIFFSLARAMCAGGKSPVQKKPLVLMAAVVVFLAANVVYSYFYVTEMPQGVLKAVLYITRAVCSVSGIVTVCMISDYLSGTKLSPFFTRLGTYSYDIYLIHAPFLVSGLMGILLAYSPLPPYVCSAAVTVVGLILPYAISHFVIRKIPPLAFILFGMKKRA